MKKKHLKRILIICPYPVGEAAGQRLKYEQYIDGWEERGYEVKISPFMSKSLWNVVYLQGNFLRKFIGILRGYLFRVRDLLIVHNFDIVYIFQWTTPFGTAFYDFIVRKLAKRMIFDLEDFVFFSKKGSSQEIRNNILKHIRSTNKTEYLIKHADHVITSSPFLNDFCLKKNVHDAATFISSSVDIKRFIPSNNYTNEKRITIGWTGTFSSKPYLDLIQNVFVRLADICDFKLRIIANFDYNIRGVDCEVIQWTKLKEVEDLQGIDVGVYPLEDSQWVLGKSGLKAIQYMAFGIPTIATDVGTTSQIIKHRENGWLVKTEEEWLEGLQVLIENQELRRKLGTKARETIVNRYSTDVIKEQYLNILK
jgi:glycosyltransferase involved in cell wall biosynthesis